MNSTILVAYASKYGATREIAEQIGAVLRQEGSPVEVLPAGDVHDLTPYQVVVLGSAVYIGKWQKDGAAFLQVHEKALAERDVWLFSSGPTGEGDPVELLEGWRLPSALQPIAERIQPRQITVFHGHINPERVNPLEKWAVKSLVKKPFGDFRDWSSIVSWATQIAVSLRDGELVR